MQFEPQEGMSPQELVGWYKYAERKGYGYALRSDHLLPIRTGAADSPECWTSLGMIAVSTKTIRFGTMVTPISYRNPALLAKMARTINTLSNGRLIFGLGAGWYEREYLAYGYEFPNLLTRLERFEEALRIIIPMTIGEKVSHRGRHFSAEVEALPKSRVYLLIGGRSPRVIKQAAILADEWNIYACSRDRFLKCKKVLGSVTSGRDIVVSQTGQVVIADSNRDLIRSIKKKMGRSGRSGDPEVEIKRMKDNGTFCGTPRELVSQVNERRELGIDRFYLEVADKKTKEMADLLTETLKGA